MMTFEKNKIGVSASFDSGTFMCFNVVSTKHPGKYSSCDTNIQDVERLTFEDFTALEIMIGSAVSDFLDMKHREATRIAEEHKVAAIERRKEK